MFKYKPNITMYLAEFALKDKFHPCNRLDEDVELYCMEGRQNIYRTFLMYQRYTINSMVVDTVFHHLPEKQAKFIIYKYKEQQNFTWIAHKLNVSASSLNVWNRDIQKNVQNMLFYNLSISDIFIPQKIISMINILDLRIASLKYGEKVGVKINKSWLESLIAKRLCYRQLISKLVECQSKYDDSSYYYVITCKCRYPNLDIDELSYRSAIHKSSIYRYINQFRGVIDDLFTAAGCTLAN